MPSVLAQIDAERIDFMHKALNCAADNQLRDVYADLFALVQHELQLTDFPL